MKNNKFFSDMGIYLKTAGRFMADFIKHDTLSKVVALVIAIFVWLFVIADQNPTRSLTIDDVKVSYTGLEELQEKGFTVDTSDLLKSVVVKISAGQDYHKYYNSDTVSAVVDLSKINDIGEFDLAIEVSLSENASVKMIKPGKVKVSSDYYVTKTVPVTYELKGNIDEEYHLRGVSLDKDTITVSGAYSKINKITHGVVIIDIDGLTASSVKAYDVELRDDSENKITLDYKNMDIPSRIATVTVSTVKYVELDKDSIIKNITDIPEGYEISGISLNPSIVQIVGNSAVIDNVDSFTIKKVSLNNSEANTLKAELDVPVGVEVLSGTEISIYVKLSEVTESKTIENITIKPVNVQSGVTVELSVPVTDVIVSGGHNIIQTIGAKDIELYVDCSNYSSGFVTLPVVAKEIDGVSVEAVTGTVAVNLH